MEVSKIHPEPFVYVCERVCGCVKLVQRGAKSCCFRLLHLCVSVFVFVFCYATQCYATFVSVCLCTNGCVCVCLRDFFVI